MNKLLISPSPHVHSGDSIEKNMYGVLIALIPAFICSVLFFGMGAIIVTLTSVVACLFFEYVSSQAATDDFRRFSFDYRCITGFQRTFELTGLDYRYRCPGGNRHR